MRYDTPLCTNTKVYIVGDTATVAGQLPLALRHTDPRSAVAEFEQILLSNSGEDAFESAIKLLAAKLFDEYQVTAGGEASFAVHKSPEQSHQAIQALYTKALLRWPTLAGGTSELSISPPHLVRSIRPLLGWQLRGSDLEWLDAALERLVSRDSKGSMGQYFTPRDVIRLCVGALNPKADEIVLDPACGSGGFLFEAVANSKQTTGQAPKCLGIDFSAKSVRVATLLAAALDDSTIVVSKANSLDGREYSHAEPPLEWKEFLVQEKASSTPRASTWGPWNRLGCDVLLTNPPFAGDIDEYELLEAYESQKENGAKKAISREHLFFERAIDLLRPGGRLAIVVPQGILANSSSAYLREWVLSKCRLLAVVGLHPHAFSPYTGVKTAIVFLQKPVDKSQLKRDYPILFTCSKSCGKDSSGRFYDESDYAQIEAILKSFFKEHEFSWAGGEAVQPDLMANAEIVNFSEVRACLRMDAEHYDPEARQLERKLRKRTEKNVGDSVAMRVGRFKKKSFQQISYVDISSVDNRSGLTFPETISAEDAPSRASYLVEPGDVLVSTVRPDRNVVAMITDRNEATPVASNGFCVLRAKDVPSELLFAYCKSEAFKKILTMRATASMYPTVGDADVASIPWLRPDSKTEDEVVQLVRSGLAMIEEAQTKIQRAIDLINESIHRS